MKNTSIIQIKRARNLRKNMTDAERKLWSVLRAKKINGCKFRRQHPIGPFIVDFFCHAKNLVIEVDGGQHADSPQDEERTAYLEDQGCRVLRFWNHDVLSNIEGVFKVIEEHCL